MRTSPDSYPTCIIADFLGNEQTPYTFTSNIVSGSMTIAAAGPVTGVTPVCQGQSGVAYSVAPVLHATGYVWSLSPGASVASGNNTNSITVNYSASAASGNDFVHGTTVCGSGAESPLFAVTVSPLPPPVITGPVSACLNSTGNVYSTLAGMTGYV